MKRLLNEKISIIVPIYNVEKYLEKCFNSLISQSYKNIEILAINDGSTDNSQKIIDEYVKHDNRIKAIIKENGGYGSVLEMAIKLIDSEYFTICDPDDYLEVNAIETLYKVANKTKADLIYGKFYHIYFDQKEEINFKSFFEIEPLHIYTKELGKFVFIPVSPHAKLYKTLLVKDLKLPYNTSFTDALLYYYALSKSRSFVFVDKFLANYLVERPGNTTTDINLKSFNDHLVVTKSIIDKIDLFEHKYLLLGLFFYNLYILITLSEQKEEIIKEAKKNLYQMYENLFPYRDCFNEIPEISDILKQIIDKSLNKNQYKEMIDSMLINTEKTQRVFYEELSKLDQR